MQKLNRRSFLKHSTLITAGTLAAAPSILHAANAGEKLKYAMIGCGGRSGEHINNLRGHKCVALVDVMERSAESTKSGLVRRGDASDDTPTFVDYRKMFDKMAKDIDAVFVATPNHQHALPAMIAMKLGKSVYVEKPVCHDVGEARKLRAMAKEYKVATQMGNQGHCDEGYHSLVEYIQSGTIGKVTEVHSWTDRANGGVGPRPATQPVPAGMHWEEYIGPAPYRDFHSDIHPHEWHGWFDFGNGSIGNMGCHALDGAFWALNIEHPTSIEVEEMRGGSDERYPMGARIRWDIPARGDMPAAKVYWYEGLRKDATGQPRGNLRTATGADRNLPPLFNELKARNPDEEFESTGTLYVGDKGIIFTGCYGGSMHIVPRSQMNSTPKPARTLARCPDRGIFNNFINAVLNGKTETHASFEYGTRLTEFCILGNLAQHVGPGKKLEWDGPNMKITNIPELNPWVSREYRKGWEI
jgi:predicted dehydrogenase